MDDEEYAHYARSQSHDVVLVYGEGDGELYHHDDKLYDDAKTVNHGDDISYRSATYNDGFGYLQENHHRCPFDSVHHSLNWPKPCLPVRKQPERCFHWRFLFYRHLYPLGVKCLPLQR